MGLMEPVLQMLEEGRAVDAALIVEGQPQVFGEGAFAGAVITRAPDADLMLSAGLHRQLHPIQKLLELLLDAVGDHVLGDLRLEAIFLGGAVGDDLFDRAIDVLAGVKEGADGHKHFPELWGRNNRRPLRVSRRRARSGNCRPPGKNGETSSGSCRCARRGTAKSS